MKPRLFCFGGGVNLLEFVKFIENNTWGSKDMEFLFECSTRYPTIQYLHHFY